MGVHPTEIRFCVSDITRHFATGALLLHVSKSSELDLDNPTHLYKKNNLAPIFRATNTHKKMWVPLEGNHAIWLCLFPVY